MGRCGLTLTDEKTHWTTLIVDQWYGEGPREVEVATDIAVWYHTGKPPVAIRWVLIRDPKKAFKPQALLSTRLEYKQHPQCSRQNSRPSQQLEESLLSHGSKSFRLKFGRCCLYA